MHIDDLGQDILWEIFLMNADLDAIVDLGGLYEPGKEPPRYRYSPLTVTRRTHKVIHLDFFDQVKNHWREEVIRRTGEAPLCLKGDLLGYRTEDFFLATTTPTSTLESFNLGYSYYRILSLPKGKLFSDNAPLLNHRWVSQLRHLTLSSPFSMPEILRATKEMPFLNSIRLESGVRALGQITSDIQLISLPQLRNIVLTGYLSTCLQFLEHVTPGLGCGVSLDPTDSRDTITETEFGNAIDIFTRYSQNYFGVYNPKRLLLSLTSKSFYIYDLLDPIRVPSSPSFKFTIQFGRRLREDANPQLLRSLMQSPMTSLTFLELLLFTNAIEPSDPDFVKFTHILSSLDTLQINSLDVLHPLLQIPAHRGVPFPALRTLKIVQSTKIYAESIEPFLAWRKKCGKPIQVLDLTFSSVSLFGNLEYLETFTGMKVMWSEQFTTEEYICGSGARERLYFDKRTY
ncbi:hypothetical protein CPB84DRAFT_1798275 [Gymnopilus junonius]|uniref:Uncharacterized protein n=1 Tax=Gymnopilus junonius TaxID=109634 RepID=A0A9P5TFA6_GYMJU|nr:hypothetical protein CPB84DRAFT_1798275 [Gymnopilus junonius]